MNTINLLCDYFALLFIGFSLMFTKLMSVIYLFFIENISSVITTGIMFQIDLNLNMNGSVR